MSLESLNSALQFASAVLLGLTFAVGAGAIYTDHLLNERHTQRMVSLERDLAQANTGLELQKQRTAEAERTVLELQHAVAACSLTGAQRERLAQTLAADGDAVAIVSPMADPEASDLAEDLNAAITFSKWRTARIRNRISNGTGLLVGCVEGTVLNGAERLKAALKDVGVAFAETTFSDGDASTDPPFQKGVIYLVVEHHPPVGPPAR